MDKTLESRLAPLVAPQLLSKVLNEVSVWLRKQEGEYPAQFMEPGKLLKALAYDVIAESKQ